MKEQIIELQKLLTEIPAINPESGGSGEWQKANALKNYLESHGFPSPVHYDTPDERTPEGSRPNFSVRIKGRKKKPCTWIMTHLDVVPPGEKLDDGSYKGWNTDPFNLHVDGDFLYGRGVEDNQQAMVAAIIAGNRLLESNTIPPNDIVLLFVSGEETGSVYGLEYLLGEHPELFDKEDYIIVPDGGNEEGTLIEVAEKSVLWLNFNVVGKQTHGSTPQFGTNAFLAMSEMVLMLHRKLHTKFCAQDDIFRPAVSTFEPTRHGKNVPNVNTLPGEENFSYDCRVLPQYGLDEIMEAVGAIIAEVDAKHGTKTRLEVENRLEAPPPTPPDAPVVKALQKALEDTRDIEGLPLGLGGSTVAAFFREAGYPAVVWSTIDGVAHQVNEHVRISNILADADVYEYLFRQPIMNDD